MPDLTEVGDRVWVARYDAYDVNATVIVGDRGFVVVDTLWSERAARGLLAEARRIVRGKEAVAVVNTHHHFDHVLGNGAPTSEHPGLPVFAHDAAATRMTAHVEQATREAAADPAHAYAADIAASHLVLPTTTFSSVTGIDLGDRSVELVHPGRGHTDGDVVVRVPDADVLLAGDLVEESGMPAYGEDCFPLDWPHALDLTLELIGPDTVVVPGHGAPVDDDFVWEQRSAVGVVAQTIRDLAGRGVRVEEALAAGQWPYPAEALADAVRRGYEQLPRGAKQLPLA